MHSSSWLAGRGTGVEGLRSAIVAGDDVGALDKIHDRRPVLMAVNADMATRFYREDAQAQLKPGCSGEFRAQVDDRSLAGREPFIALWCVGGNDRAAKAENGGQQKDRTAALYFHIVTPRLK